MTAVTVMGHKAGINSRSTLGERAVFFRLASKSAFTWTDPTTNVTDTATMAQVFCDISTGYWTIQLPVTVGQDYYLVETDNFREFIKVPDPATTTPPDQQTYWWDYQILTIAPDQVSMPVTGLTDLAMRDASNTDPETWRAHLGVDNLDARYIMQNDISWLEPAINTTTLTLTVKVHSSFGIDSNGHAYFQPGGAANGEEAMPVVNDDGSVTLVKITGEVAS